MKFDMPTCGGCRTCEMACSFKHEEEFNPSISSIKILNKEVNPVFRSGLLKRATARPLPAIGCKDFKVPICLEYCKERTISVEIERFPGKKKVT